MNEKIGFFYDRTGVKSMCRLCMFIGTCGGVLIGLAMSIAAIYFTDINPWIFAMPGSIMFCGNIPYILKIAKHAEMAIMGNPTLVEKISDKISDMLKTKI